MNPTQDIGLPLLLEIDPLSPLEASLAGVLGASVAGLLLDPQCAKRRAKDDNAVEGRGRARGMEQSGRAAAGAGMMTTPRTMTTLPPRTKTKSPRTMTKRKKRTT